MPPLRDWSLQSTWESAYQVQEVDPDTGVPVRGARVSYSRRSRLPAMLARRAESVSVSRGWQKNAALLVVGCGYGWALEWLIANGFSNAWGTDTSALVHANAATESEVADRIVNADVSTAVGRTALETATGNRSWRAILTEDVLPCLSDAEVVALHEGCAAVLHPQGDLVHMVTPRLDYPQDDGFNWKSLDEWRALIPGVTFVDPNGRG